MIRFNTERLQEIFSSFQNKKILVVGDLMLDEYLRGQVNRLSPEAPVPIVEIEQESYHFGGAANVSFNLKTLGCQPVTIGLVGNDRAGGILKDLLAEHGMVTEGIVVRPDLPTTVKTRIIGDNQHIARVDREKIRYEDAEVFKTLAQRFDDLLDEASAVILEDYNKGVLSSHLIQHIVQKAGAHNKLITVDPKFYHFLEYKDVTVFKPNLREVAHALARPIETDEEVVAAGKELLEKLHAQAVMITRGSQGLSLIEANGDVNHIPTRTRKVADVSGAGDTVISTLTAALAGGANLKEAATIANFAAGLVCEEVGIVPVQKGALLEIIQKNHVINHA
ncbi:D-glycero-beta-D-manno-heptose-7-phosphate kinase [candidate division KSB1 bacterium]|nr:MAG: D-glycero-beta-D-manno-heptose-7-phosphate kinase [candidate division KSB1 bacterium]